MTRSTLPGRTAKRGDGPRLLRPGKPNEPIHRNLLSYRADSHGADWIRGAHLDFLRTIESGRKLELIHLAAQFVLQGNH